MKKIALIAVVSIAAFAFASCSKTCTCVQAIDGVTFSTTEVKTTKSCSSLNTTSTTAGIVQTLTCK
jgi:azurin